jgi:hypothetical protein
MPTGTLQFPAAGMPISAEDRRPRGGRVGRLVVQRRHMAKFLCASIVP